MTVSGDRHEYELSPGVQANFLLNRFGVVVGRSRAQLLASAVMGPLIVVTLFSSALVPGYAVVVALLVELAAWQAAIHVPYRGGSGVPGTVADGVLTGLRWLRRGSKVVPYRSAGASAGVDADSGMPAVVEPPGEVGPVMWLDAVVGGPSGDESVGIARHLSSDRVAAFLEVVAPPRGVDDGLRDDVIAGELAAIHRQIGSGGVTEILVQLVDVCPAADRPSDSWDVVPLVDGTPPVIVQGRAESAEEASASPTYRSYHGVVVAWGRNVQRAVKAKGGGDGGLGAVMVREVEALARALPGAGYTVKGPLSVSSLVSLTRRCYDPSVQTLPPERSLAPNVVRRPLDTRYAWPMARCAPTKRYIEVDGWFASVWEVGLPYAARPAGFDADLVTSHPEIRRRHVQLRRLVPNSVALAKLESARDVNTSLALSDSEELRPQKVRDEMSTSALRVRTKRVGAGDIGAAVVEYVILYGQSERELQENEEAMRTEGDKCGRPFTPQYADQERALCVGLPFGQGIK